MILLSLAAALVFAVASVLQQHAAAAQPPEHNLRPILVIRLLRRPLWLAGIAASAVGTCLQLLALWHGSLVTVQPLLVCGLLFALPINAIWMHKRRPGARELLAAATVCSGLAIFLLATDPRPGRGTGSATGWAIALSALFAVVAVLVGCALAAKGAWRAGFLATAAGVINGLSAAFTKGIARGLAAAWHGGPGHAFVRALTNWELYAFAAATLVVVLFVQSSFQSGPIRWSLPAITAANPIASVLLGGLLLGEHIRSTPLALAGAGTGLLLVVAGIMALSSSNLITGGAEALAQARAPASMPTAVESSPVPVAVPAVVPAAVSSVVSSGASGPKGVTAIQAGSPVTTLAGAANAVTAATPAAAAATEPGAAAAVR